MIYIYCNTKAYVGTIMGPDFGPKGVLDRILYVGPPCKRIPTRW
jgi:hypothetical protein